MANTVTFQNGLQMPLVGLGTYQAESEGEMETALDAALEAGYRHIDTAYLYNNEHIIGKVLKKWFDSGRIKREDLFIVTKLPGIGMQPNKVSHFVNKSLELLQLTYVDLYLVHAPFGLKYVDDDTRFPLKDGKALIDTDTDLVAIWKALEAHVDDGKVRSLGVSNFNCEQIERIVKIAKHKPMNHQVEMHAYFQQKEMREFCKKMNITVCAYAPLGSPGRKAFYAARGITFVPPEILENPVITTIAGKHGKSSGQVLLRFLVQQGVVVIPKSTNPKRVVQNFQVFDFELTDDEMTKLNGLDQGKAGRTFMFTLFPGISAHSEFPFKDEL